MSVDPMHELSKIHPEVFQGPDGYTYITYVRIGWLSGPGQFRAFLDTLNLSYGYSVTTHLTGQTFWIRAAWSQWQLIGQWLEGRKAS